MQRFEDLSIWQRSRKAALAIYRWTKALPSDERFGLTSQLRRAAVSVPTNIAEGCHRFHNTDFARFLNIAEGSLGELRSLIWVALDLEYGSAEDGRALLQEVRQLSAMVYRFRQTVEARGSARPDTAESEMAKGADTARSAAP
jgi:four helix bundle protein